MTASIKSTPAVGQKLRNWLQHVTLYDALIFLAGPGRWRGWLIVCAIGLAIVAQNSFPPSDVSFDPIRPLPQPAWLTLLTLSGPFEPFRLSLGLYFVALCLVILAFLGPGAPPFVGNSLRYLSADEEINAVGRTSTNQFRTRIGQWLLSLTIDGPIESWLGVGLVTALLTLAFILALIVFSSFNQPDGQSNFGLAVWSIAIFLIVLTTTIVDLVGYKNVPLSRSIFIGFAVSLFGALIAAVLLWQGLGDHGLGIWFISLLVLGGVWWLNSPHSPASKGNLLSRITLKNWVEIGLFIVIIEVTAYFRLSHITSLSPGVNNDAAEGARIAIKYALGLAPYTPFSNIGWGFESLFIYLISFWVQLVQPAYLAVRLAAATVGIATIPVVYLLTRRLGGSLLALVSSALLATSGIHVVYSAVGWRLIIQPLIESFTLYFFWRGFDEKRWSFFLLGGLFLGIAINAHDSSRPDIVLYFLFIMSLFLGAGYLYRRFLARFTVPLLIAGVTFLIALAPIAGYATGNWGVYNARANYVFVGHVMDQLEADHPGDYWSPFVTNVFSGSLIFNQRGNGNDFYVNDPAFEFPVNILLILGLAYTLRYWRKPLPFFLLCWFAMGVTTGYLSQPNANRTVGALLPAYIMMGLFLIGTADLLGRFFHPRAKNIAVGAIGILLLGIAFSTYNNYVGPNRLWRWGYGEETTAFGAYAANIVRQPDKTLYATADVWVTDVLALMTYEYGRDPYQLPYQRADMAQALAGELPKDKTAVYILGNWQEDMWARDALLQRYPASYTEPIPRIETPWTREGPVGYAVYISPTALAETQQLTNGLRVKFYQGLDWSGDPYENYVDRFFSFPNEPPHVPFSASWEGSFPIEKEGEYLFHFRATNRAQFFIDGNRVVNFDSFDINASNDRDETEVPLTLTTGMHTLKVLYQYEAGDREIRITWRLPETDGLQWLTFENFTPAPP